MTEIKPHKLEIDYINIPNFWFPSNSFGNDLLNTFQLLFPKGIEYHTGMLALIALLGDLFTEANSHLIEKVIDRLEQKKAV